METIDKQEYDFLYPEQIEFFVWVEKMEREVVQEEIYSPFNTVNS